MSKGGYRPTSGRPPGRPKGSKDRVPRKKRAPSQVTIAQRTFLQSVEQYVLSGAPFAKLKELSEDPDPRVSGWAIKELLSYGIGLPTSRKDMTPEAREAKELGELIRQVSEEAQAEFEDKVKYGSLPPPRAREPLISGQKLLPGPRDETPSQKSKEIKHGPNGGER